MWRVCAVLGLWVIAGCGEVLEPAVARGRLESAEDAARAHVGELWRRGPKGMAELAALLRHPDVTEAHVSEVFRRLPPADEVGKPEGLDLLAAPLVALAEDPARPLSLRSSALAALSYLGEASRSFAPRVWPLLDEPELFSNAWSALFAMRWEPLIDVLIPTLDADHSGYQLRAIRDLGRFGPKAARAVPALSKKLLSEEPFDERDEIIETLESIGTTEAKAALIRALDSPRWQDVKLAAKALSDLSVFEAVPSLRRVAQTHWRPGVRRLAEVVADGLERRRRGEPPRTITIKFSTLCIEDWGATPVVEHGGRELEVPIRPRKSPPARPRGFPSAVKFGEDEGCVSDFARVEGGWAVALDCGEFGGSVEFVGDDGRMRRLSPLHADQFLRLGERLFAIGGLSHMGLDYGFIVEFVRGQDSRWVARETAQPIGTPHARLMTEDGLILVGDPGATLLRPDGTQQELMCVVPGKTSHPAADVP